MSLAELDEWAWKQQGIEVAEGGGRYWIVRPQSRFNEAPEHPTTSIAEAFALTALLKTDDQKAAFGFELMRLVLDGEWPEENIPDFEAFEIAMASPEQRCKAVYWAVEGERVELREAL